jgi:hypothetical protein
VQSYKDQIQWAEEQRKRAKAAGDEATVELRTDEIKRLKKALKEEEQRTTQRFSTGMMVGGIVLSGVGGLSLIASLAVGVVALSGNQLRGETATAFYITFIGGLGCAGAGIPLAVIGSKREPIDSSASAKGPSLLVSPQGAALRFSF